MRKLLSVLFSTLQGGVRGGLLFLLFFASAINIYASDIKVGGIWYDFDSSTKTASVTYIGNSYDDYDDDYSGSVIIPETVTYNGTTYSVTNIGDYAFYNCSKLTSVTIGESVTSIGDYAFLGCSSLTSVTIPNSVTSIGESAFSHCSSLTSVTIGESVTSIGDYAFHSCSSLTSVTIGESVTSIGWDAFYGCSSLTSVTIPNSVGSIGHGAFQSCSSLTSVTIGESVTSIGASAFSGCSSLTSVTINSDAIVSKAYSYDSNISHIFGSQVTEYIIGESVTSIGESAFEDCSSLTSVTIGESVTSIGESAFEDCSSLTSVTIGESVTSIGGYAFSYCTSLTSVTIGESVTSIGDYAFRDCSSLTSVTIGESVTSIGESAFEDCSSLTSVTIGESVTSIGDDAFYGCTSLTSVTIGNSVTSIGSSAFSYCTSLTSVTIPNSVTSIGASAFSYCSSLTSVTIGESVTSIGNYAFSGCSALTSIVVKAGNTTYDSRENCNAIIETTSNTLIAGCQKTIIPNSVTSIGASAFRDCSSLTSVTIGESVTSIGGSAFYGCSSLTSVTIGESVTSIGSSAFYGCSSLTKTNYTGDIAGWCNIKFGNNNANPMCYSHNFYINDQEIKDLVVPNNVTSIGDYAFYGCSSLTSVTIPNSVTSIGDYAFYGCSSLTSVTIPNSVTSIGDVAFYDCSSLTSVTIGESVTSIGDYAFRSCSSLTSVTIGESVEYIGSSAFYSCSKLTSVTIPNSVGSIGYGAFQSCSSMTSVTIGESVTSIGGSAFEDCSSLTSVTINSDAIVSKAYSYDSNISHIFGSQVTEYIIGESVTSIGKSAFRNCSSLTSITCEAATPPTISDTYTFYGVSKSIPVYVPCGCVEAYKAASGWRDFTNIQVPLLEYSIEVYVNDTIMGTAKVNYNTFCEGAQISATPNIGYHFVQWSDGNTENPRTLELTQDTILTAEFAQSFSGQCGDNLYWSYDETTKTISITGSGKMYDYTADTQPWLLFKEQIVEVTTTNTVTSIGTSAFEGCIRLSKISLGTGLEEIAANAFAGCTRLYDIYVYATYPPFAEESSFANYNVYVYIPCEYQRDYILDVVWGNFKFIECIDSEEATTDGNVTIVPGFNDVTITWPTETGADSYTIVIKKGDTVFCTLTFNADGQLLNIAFAPGRDGNHPAQYAEQAGNGYRFTVTGLEEGTHYAYNIDVRDAANTTIKSHTGEFTTESTTPVENTHTSSPMTNCKKIIRDNQLLILRDGNTYNVMGVIVE